MALEQLGFGPCYHMFEILKNPERVKDWSWAAQGGKPDWDAIYRGYAAAVDWPGATYWRELTKHFPDAKVILSVRDPDEWFDSTQRTIFNPVSLSMFSDDVKAMGISTVQSLFDERIHDRDHCTAVFKKHNQSVIDSVEDSRLLVAKPGDGWAPICAFLGCEIPETPYPKANDKAEFEALVSSLPAGATKALFGGAIADH